MIDSDFGSFEININIPDISRYDNHNNVNTINKEDLEKLKIISYLDLNELEKKEKYTECSICLSEYNDESNIRLLKCEHGFHPECVDIWLKKYNNNCPVCRNGGHK